MIRKRPELDTVNPPGQINNMEDVWAKAHYQDGRDLFPPPHFEKPVVKEVAEYKINMNIFPNCRCQFEEQCIPECPKYQRY